MLLKPMSQPKSIRVSAFGLFPCYEADQLSSLFVLGMGFAFAASMSQGSNTCLMTSSIMYSHKVNLAEVGLQKEPSGNLQFTGYLARLPARIDGSLI